MKRVATVEWHSPPPTSVDERLAIFDDGSAWLVVRRPRALSGPIGSFVTRPVDADVQLLTAAGPGPVVLELLSRPGDAASAGAYIHGLAGILAGRSSGEGTLASDIARCVPEAVNRVREDV